MQKHFGRFVLILTLLILVSYFLFLLLNTINIHSLKKTLFTLNTDQLHFLLVLTACLIALYEITHQQIAKQEYKQLFTRPTISAAQYKTRLHLIWHALSLALAVIGFAIPFLDLLGSLPGSLIQDPSILAAKLTLIILTTIYIFNSFERMFHARSMIKELVQENGVISVVAREEFHQFMSGMLDTVEKGAEILVTQFEEPRTPMRQAEDYGFYYEDAFMKKWYNTIKERQLRVTQIVLVNSDQDMMDLEKRLKLVENIPTFSLISLLAPPLTVFVDFMIVPGKFALIGLSDDRGMRNMDVFGLIIQGGKGVSHFQRLFTDVLVPEGRYLKTFEGVDARALAEFKSEASRLARVVAGAKSLRGWFNFT
jgi:hypothetical protein